MIPKHQKLKKKKNNPQSLRPKCSLVKKIPFVHLFFPKTTPSINAKKQKKTHLLDEKRQLLEAVFVEDFFGDLFLVTKKGTLSMEGR